MGWLIACLIELGKPRRERECKRNVERRIMFCIIQLSLFRFYSSIALVKLEQLITCCGGHEVLVLHGVVCPQLLSPASYTRVVSNKFDLICYRRHTTHEGDSSWICCKLCFHYWYVYWLLRLLSLYFCSLVGNVRTFVETLRIRPSNWFLLQGSRFTSLPTSDSTRQYKCGPPMGYCRTLTSAVCSSLPDMDVPDGLGLTADSWTLFACFHQRSQSQLITWHSFELVIGVYWGICIVYRDTLSRLCICNDSIYGVWSLPSFYKILD